MDAQKIADTGHTYDNWKAVTESDFVTLFIKTWFAFVSTLIELYPRSKPYYEAVGDSSFLTAYKRDFCDKFFFLSELDSETEQSLVYTYKSGLEMISKKYPRFLIEDFYKFNNSYSDTFEETIESPGEYTGNILLSVKSTSKDSVNVIIRYDDEEFLSKTNQDVMLLNLEIDYGEIANGFIRELEINNRAVDEEELIHYFYKQLFNEVFREITKSLNEKSDALPDKGFKQVKGVFLNIQSFCRRAIDNMKNSCLEASIGPEHKLLFQMPMTDFLQSYGDMNETDKQNAYLWFISFVYRLRNALFHEIIDPLEPSWQLLFKNAYLVLKQIVDCNISRLKSVNCLLQQSITVFESDFKDSPPPNIPIDNNTEFTYENLELKRYDEKGAKVHIVSVIICQEKKYKVNCDVKWDETLETGIVKNVSIVEL